MKSVKGIELKHVKATVLSITEDDKKLDGIKLKFNALHEDKVYFTSIGDIVRVLPKDLEIDLDINSLSEFYGALIETVSSYLFEIRNSVIKKDFVQEIKSSFNNKYKIRVRVSKMFFREEDKGRYKISISFLDLDTDEEVVNISFSKSDIQILLSVIRNIVSEYDKDYGTFIIGEYEDLDSGEITKIDNLKMVKVDNSILIGDVWLHGQEIANLQYIANELVNKLHIEKDLKKIQTRYRQISVTYKGDIVYLTLTKMNKVHEVENNRVLRIPITQRFLAMFYLYLNIDILSRIPEEDFIDKDVIMFGKRELFPGEEVKYHMSMRESILSVAIKDRKKSKDSKLLLLGKAKSDKFTAEGHDGEELENFIPKYVDGEKEYVDLLQDFKIDLQDQWKKLIRGLSQAYTQEYLEKRERNRVLFFVINNDETGRYKYQFTILSDVNNAAPAVLIIEKYKLKKGEDEEFISRYRQPLFKKYIYQLISMILVTAKEMNYMRFAEEMKSATLMAYSYKSFNRVQQVKKSKMVEYGIEKKLDGDVIFGNLEDSKTHAELTDMDRTLLTISSEFKIFNGYWLPFRSEQITIGQDGYLRDMYSELNLEAEETYSVDWATVFYFGSRI